MATYPALVTIRSSLPKRRRPSSQPFGSLDGLRNVGILPAISKLSADIDPPAVQRHSTRTAAAAQPRNVATAHTECEPHNHRRTSRIRRPRPLTGNNLADAIRRYNSGETLKSIAADLGTSRTFIGEQLTKAGIQFRNRPMSVEEISQATHMYKQGSSLATIGKKLNFSPSTVGRMLKDTGIRMRDTHGREQ